MKRPLCFISLIITAIVFIYLEFSVSTLTNYSPVAEDGSFIEMTGIVSEKEVRLGLTGEEVLVIYLIPSDRLKGNFKYVECYLENDGFKPYVGEMVSLGGKVSAFSSPRNPGEFDSRLYYSSLKIAYRLYNTRIYASDGKRDFIKENLYRLRRFLENILDNRLDKNDSSIMKAVLLGDKAFMDEEVKELYKNSGIMHVLAVSGLHISILGMGVYKLLKKLKLPMVLGTSISIAIMFLYGSMCGLSTSAFRAICMFVVMILSKVLGRTYDVLSALALSELLLIFDQPLYLYNSGFLFSFAAVVAIALIKPNLFSQNDGKRLREMRFVDDKKDGFIKRYADKAVESLKVGICVTIMTLPVYVSFYYTFPIYSFFLNIVVLPLMEPLMILGIILLLTGCIAYFLVSIVSMALLGMGVGIFVDIEAFLIHVILKIYSTLCLGTGILPGKILYLGHSQKWKIVLYYVLVALIIIFPKVKTNNKVLRYRYCGKWLVLISATVILLYKNLPDLQISMIDVGQGDSILLRTHHETILIDGGSTSKKKVGKYSIIPYLSYEDIGKLDAVVITHEDLDHISGILEIFDLVKKDDFVINNLILPDVYKLCRKKGYLELEEAAKELGIPVSYISCGEKIAFKDLELTCLNPQKDMTVEGANEYSTVLYLKYGQFKALFTGDVEGKGQEHLVADIKKDKAEYEDLTLLKVAHHGSRYTTDTEFVELLSPKVACISCGEGNSYGHPHAELLERLKNSGTRIYRTDESGNITVKINGNKMNIRAFLD